ncbi:MAG TPA: protein kinase [Candidatus Eisenbacteria bacterium]
MIGKTIGQYRIVEQIGRGGMGVVYLAEDLKLQRRVALKFLPEDLLADDTDRARFLQEARAASQINHPHVCTVYAIEEREARPFIAMEWVDGVTLRGKLAAGLLPLATVLDWAIAIAEALDEAHARGVVHRDLKSENVMVNARGQVKVMDFGLAKLRGALKLTRTGPGTLSYLAPEAVRGGVADARSDLFSFGVLLYELLAGRLPFPGEREVAVIYAILNAAPEPIQTWRPGLSSEWQHVLDRLLEKDPEDRYQTAREALIDLRRIKRGLGREAQGPARVDVAAAAPGASAGLVAEGAAAPTAPTRASAPARRGPWIGRLGVTAAFLAMLAVLVPIVRNRAPRISPSATFRAIPLPFTQISYPGMSPDGHWIAFGAAGGEARRITADSARAIQYVDVSNDGSQIAYAATDDARRGWELRVVEALGGSGRRLADFANGPHWSPDGRRIGYVTAAFSQSKRPELWTVPAGGGEPRLEFADLTPAAPPGRRARLARQAPRRPGSGIRQLGNRSAAALPDHLPRSGADRAHLAAGHAPRATRDQVYSSRASLPVQAEPRRHPDHLC